MGSSKKKVRELAATLSKKFPSKWHSHYTKIKVRTDPAYEAIWEELKGRDEPVMDIGCGLGLLAFYLRERGYSGTILGTDFDAKKIAAAEAVSEAHYDGNVDFRAGDARKGLPTFSGSVTILDILQFFDGVQQEELLREAAARVAPGGLLLIRGCLKTRGWRYRVTQAGDIFAVVTFWMPRAVRYPTENSIRTVLEDCGLRGEIRPLWGKTPFNNYLAVFERLRSV